MKTKLIDKKELVSGVWEMSFDTKNQNFSFRAGQYVRLVLPNLDTDDTKGPARLFSISSSPSEKEKLQIAFRASDSGFKKTLLNMPIGSEAKIEGPFGTFALPINFEKPIVFIAGGTGITPFLSMIRHVAEQKPPHRINLLYGSRNKNSVAFQQELEALVSRNPQIKVSFAAGLINEKLIRKNSPKDFDAFFYLSGPPAMLDVVRSILRSNKTPAENIYYEEWSGTDFLNTAVRNVFEISTDAIFLTDLSGIIKYVNPTWEELSGWTAKEVIDHYTPRIQKSGKQNAEYYKKIWDYHLRGVIFRDDIINKRRDKSLYEIDHLYVPLLSEAKKVVGFIAFQRQISKQKIRQYEQTRAILASIGEGIVVTDEKGVIILMNHKAEEMLELQAMEVIGKYWYETLWAENERGEAISKERQPFYLALIGTPSTATYYIRRGKTKFPATITTAPFPIVNKEVGGAVVIFRDVTKEKELEKIRRDFLSLASHQLRTPLSGTKWLIETIQRGVIGKTTKKQGEYLSQIYKINERMIKLVFDMLGTLRLESGAAVVQKETIPISQLYEELSLMMTTAAKAKGVILHNVLKNHKMVVVETDITMLRGILECFISNAINYSSPGQEVILDMKEESTTFTFLVKDFGIGIPREEQKRIFERFYRASNAKALKPEGTGLGLYISSMLADKLGAEIVFESAEGKGSTFYLRVPKKVVSNNNMHTKHTI